jgi:hypothetical protein
VFLAPFLLLACSQPSYPHAASAAYAAERALALGFFKIVFARLRHPMPTKKVRTPRRPKPVPFDLSKTLGNISMQWNYLEVQYHEIISAYLPDLPHDVSAAILNAMGSGQKADFFEFLVAKYEGDDTIKQHIAHFAKMIQIATENRNIAQHSLPSAPFETFDYEGVIFKRNRLGKPIPYEASDDDLRQVLDDVEETRGYAIDILGILHARLAHRLAKKRRVKASVNPPPRIQQWLALIEKPPLPKKLVPNPLGSVPKGG